MIQSRKRTRPGPARCEPTSARYAAELLDRLPTGAAVLDLGCGAGIPTTAALAERFDVTGVDIAARHVELARRNVPSARFIHADMAAVDFPSASFDAVAAFYSIIHLPREEHAGLLRAIAGWLQPGGLLVATMGANAEPGDIEPDWLGAPWTKDDSDTLKYRPSFAIRHPSSVARPPSLATRHSSSSQRKDFTCPRSTSPGFAPNSPHWLRRSTTNLQSFSMALVVPRCRSG